MRFLIFICLVLVFFSCQKEDILIDHARADERINAPFYDPTEQALELIQKYNADLSINSLNAGDSILKEKIFLLTDTFYHVRDSITNHNSYTFSFYRIGRDSLEENLVLQQQADGSYKPYYVSYDLQMNSTNDVNHFIFNNVEEVMSFHSGAFAHLQSQVESRCIKIPIVLCVERCPCQDHCPLQGCECHIKPKGVISFILDCDLSNPFGSGGGGSGTDVPSFTISSNTGGPGSGGGTGGSEGDIPGGVLDSTSTGGGTPSSNLGGGITTPNLDINRTRIIRNAMLWFDERGITYPSNPWFGENLDFLLALQSFDEQNDVDAYYEFIQAMIDLKGWNPNLSADWGLNLYGSVITNPEISGNYLNSCIQSINLIKLNDNSEDVDLANIQNACTVYNGVEDAARHAFWNGLAGLRIGVDLTNILTDAHEDIVFDPNYENQYKEKDMDLWNNWEGLDAAREAINNGIILTKSFVKSTIINKVNNGDCRMLNNLDLNCRATNQSILVTTL